MAPVPVDENGLCVDEADKALDQLNARLIYVTPSHQFPTGVVLPLLRRLKLLQWARENNAVIVEDDYDSEFRYSGLPIPALSALDDSGVTMYTGTFLKADFPIVAAFGYMVVPPDLVHTYCWLSVLDDHKKRAANHRTACAHGFHHRRFTGTSHSANAHVLRSQKAKRPETITKCFGDQVKVVGWKRRHAPHFTLSS